MLKLPRLNLRTAVVDPQTEWTRRKLQLLLGAVVLVVLALVAGGAWTVISMLTGGPTSTHGAQTRTEGSRTTGGSAEDKLAEKRLPQATLEAAQPGDLSSGQTGTLEIPGATGVGPAAVASGFPHTPEGALAQLAAIDQAAISSASVRVAQEVIGQWALPGGPTAQTWSGVEGVTGLLAAAGMSSDAAGSIQIEVEPSMGFIKGKVGEDFVIPCIDFIITATTAAGQPQRVAAADCQRMVWREDTSSESATTGAAGGRWMIGAGAEPAQAPSLWPGSQNSFDVGYQWLETAA